MDKNEFAQRWPLIRDQVKARWSKLTDQDLNSAAGNVELVIELIQEKYGESRQAIDLQLKSLGEHREYVR